MLYHYIAADNAGRLEEADVDAVSLEEALRFLAGKDLRPVSVKPVGQKRRSFFPGGAISLADKVFLTKYLALMLSVGTDLLTAINILIADFEKPAVKNFLLEVRDNLSKGRPFHEVFALHPKYFSKVFVSLVRAAESSGNLEATFAHLNVSLTKEAELRSKIKSAFIYPIIILSASLGLFLFLVTFALPKIGAVFNQGGIQPPLFSRVVFGVGEFVGANIWGFLISVIGGLGLAFWFFMRTDPGKAFLAQVFKRTPVIRTLMKEIAVQRFAATFSSLLKAGLPIVEATKITSEVVGSRDFERALMRIADEGLAKGSTIGEAFRREPVFPSVVTSLMAISEKAGHLSDVLETLADFYATAIDTSVKTLISFLEPALLLFMGIMVGGIALSIIVPIYQLTSQF